MGIRSAAFRRENPMPSTRTAAAPSPARAPRRRRRVVSVAPLGGVVLAGVLAAPAAHAELTGGKPRPDAVQQSLDRLVGVDHFPGAMASVRQPSGRVRNY